MGRTELIRVGAVSREKRVSRHHVLERIANMQHYASFCQSGEQAFSRNVSNQCILREWATTKAADSRIKTAAAGVICGQHFRFSLAGRAMEMHADVSVG